MLLFTAESHSADKSSVVSWRGVCHFFGDTPIASYYPISIAQVAVRIGTTTQDVLDFLASKTQRQLIGNDIQDFYFVCRTVARKLGRTI
jgi:hypothetical protein